MRHKSLTNSRKHEDITLRRAYMDANRQDEILKYFPRDGGMAIVEMHGKVTLLDAFGTDSTDPHHIAGGANGADRWDLVTNLSAVCDLSHKWCERFRPEGFIVCAKMKIDKGEWDDVAMRETVLGLRRPGASVISYLAIRRPQFEWVRKILEELVEIEQEQA